MFTRGYFQAVINASSLAHNTFSSNKQLNLCGSLRCFTLAMISQICCWPRQSNTEAKSTQSTQCSMTSHVVGSPEEALAHYLVAPESCLPEEIPARRSFKKSWPCSRCVTCMQAWLQLPLSATNGLLAAMTQRIKFCSVPLGKRQCSRNTVSSMPFTSFLVGRTLFLVSACGAQKALLSLGRP